MAGMQIFIAITTAAPVISIFKTCRLDDRCGIRVKKMWFAALVKSYNVTHYIFFIDSRQEWFVREEALKAFNYIKGTSIVMSHCTSKVANSARTGPTGRVSNRL